MRKTFIEYYGLNSKELDELWEKGLIVFDTNVLLSLYRLPKDVRDNFLLTIKSLKNRLWLPEQVGYEYHEQRIKEAFRPIDNLNSLLDRFRDFENKIEQDFISNPYIEYKKIKSAFKALCSKIERHTREWQVACPDFLREDFILNEITELYDGRIGGPYTEKALTDIYKKGAERYANNIPPGFKDTKKQKGERHRFGDLIIWLQIIEQAKTVQKGVIFVTDDKKEDWWEEHNHNKLGPRRELIREFRRETGNQMLWFFTPDRFLAYAKSVTSISIKAKTIEELKKVAIDWPLSLTYNSPLPGKITMDTYSPLTSLGEYSPLTSLGESNLLDKGLSSLLATSEPGSVSSFLSPDSLIGPNTPNSLKPMILSEGSLLRDTTSTSILNADSISDLLHGRSETKENNNQNKDNL